MKNLFYLVIVIMGLLFVSCENGSSNGFSGTGTAWSSRVGTYTGTLTVGDQSEDATIEIEIEADGSGTITTNSEAFSIMNKTILLDKADMDSTEPLQTDMIVMGADVTVIISGQSANSLTVNISGEAMGWGTFTKTSSETEATWSTRVGTYSGSITITGAGAGDYNSELVLRKNNDGTGAAVITINETGVDNVEKPLAKDVMDSTEPLTINQIIGSSDATITITARSADTLEVEVTGASAGSGTLTKTSSETEATWLSRVGTYSGPLTVGNDTKDATLSIVATSGGAGTITFVCPGFGVNASIPLRKEDMDSTGALTSPPMNIGGNNLVLTIAAQSATTLTGSIAGDLAGSGTFTKN